MKETERFSNRVKDYQAYRPDYPRELIPIFQERGMKENSHVADIGSGTGIFSRLIAPQVEKLYAVEPNSEMAEQGRTELASYPHCRTVRATAEDTTLEESSLDCIFSAQAFHWFEPDRARQEFKRILKPHGRVFLIWNERQENTDFLKEYEALLKGLNNDYKQVGHRNRSDREILSFFEDGELLDGIQNIKRYNLESFLGRVFSSSYTPAPDHRDYLPFKWKLQDLFAAHEKSGLVDFHYTVKVFHGLL